MGKAKLKLFKESIGVYLHDLEGSKDFLKEPKKHKPSRKNIGKFD